MTDQALCKLMALEIDATLARTIEAADGRLTVLLNLSAWAFQAVPEDGGVSARDNCGNPSVWGRQWWV